MDKLGVKLGVDELSQFQSDMKAARTSVEQSTSGMAAAVDKIKKTINSDMSSLLGIREKIIALAGPAGLGYLIKRSIDTADEIYKMSQKVGVSTENLSTLKFAAELADVGLEALGTGLQKLSKNVAEAASGSGDARDAFSALGIDLKKQNGQLKNSDELLLEIATKFQGMADGVDKTALAMKLFGKSGADLIPLLNSGGSGIAELQAQARSLRLELSTEAAQAAEKFNDQLTVLKAGSEGLARSFSSDLLPKINEIISAVLTARSESGTLMSLWVALGGIAASVALDTPKQALHKSIKETEQQLAALQKKASEKFPIATLQNLFGKDYSAEIDEVKAKLKALQDQEKAMDASESAAARRRREEAAKEQEAKEKVAAAIRKTMDAQAAKETAEKKAVAEAEALRKKGEDAILGMEKERETIIQISREEKARWETSAGQYAKLDGDQKKRIIALARELDILDLLKKNLKDIADAEKERIENSKKIDEQNNTMALQVSTYGMSAKAAALYKMQLSGANQEQLAYASTLLDMIDAQKKDTDQKEKAKKIYEDTRTPLEKYEEAIAEINELYYAGKFGALDSAAAVDTHRRALELAKKTMEDTTKSGKDDFKELQQAIEGWGKNSANAMAEFAIEGKSSFSDLAKSVIKDILSMIIYQKILKGLFSGISTGIDYLVGSGSSWEVDFNTSMTTGRATGGTVTPGRMYEVNETGAPELLNVGSRQFLMMGSQAGYVTAAAVAGGSSAPAVGGTPTVNIYNNTNSEISTQMKESANGMELDVIIDKAVAKKIGTFGSGTNKTLRQNFGAKERLVNR